MANYIRVIPRDLFNEANLLKCLGHLWIALETAGQHHRAAFVGESVEHFEIHQNPHDGSISVVNLPFAVDNEAYRLSRPLNSRAPWPLWLSSEDQDFEPIQVFDDSGRLSTDMLQLIGGK